MRDKKTPVNKQPPSERIKNFREVSLGYTPEQAIQEAGRCLQCKKAPCIKGCPVEIDIPAFIREIKAGNFQRAWEVLQEKNCLPAICGRVCPQETQCELLCTLAKKVEPVAIGRLERFAADWGRAHQSPVTGHQSADATWKACPCKPEAGARPGTTEAGVAVIGSGPAGLTCAGELARSGVPVTVFESLHLPGGVLTYGIPEFRLPKDVVAYEVNCVKNLGAQILTDAVIGKTLSLDEIFNLGYRAIFIATGAGLPSFMHVPGENLLRVYSANEFLTRVNLMKSFDFPGYDTPVSIGKKVAVIGGGNVAMDSARCARRLGAEKVAVLYRRTEAEMPCRREEYENAVEEGIEFQFLVQPLEILADEKGYVQSIRIIRNQLGEPDESGRRRPVPIPGSETVLNFDTVVVAIGQSPNPLIPKSFPQLKVGKHGNIIADPETGYTGIPGIYAGGDIATGAATVISAMGAGKKAAQAILQYLKDPKQIPLPASEI